ncbi:MAG: 6-bladed beta-propeller [Gracilimonas sp.]|uniref:6-bladed beta-propeller n=1 Tax=Gracilimonas sp. TaxID=1974203 RepID=UPI0019B3CF26|nr:6-bladed beta-propeller [Gracilimonas sp.]MBD3617250.1 6-bladed beta-propeller [Gracilimonas sp.]
MLSTKQYIVFSFVVGVFIWMIPLQSEAQNTYKAEEELRIGTIDGEFEYIFARISDLALGADGTIFVTDSPAGDPVVRLFDENGSFIKYVGRDGRGPGEYGRIGGIGSFPDGRLAIWDIGNQRINVYEPNGDFAESFLVTSGLHSSYKTFEVDHEGNFYLKVMFFDRNNPQSNMNPPKAWYKISPTGELVDTLHVPQGEEDYPQSFVIFTDAGAGYPFNTQMLENFSSSGHVITAVNNQYEIVLHKEDGPVLIQREYSPLEVTSEEEEQWENFKKRFTSGGYNIESSIPDKKPPFKELLTDSQGRIWVWRYTKAQPVDGGIFSSRIQVWEPPVFDVFNPDGSFYGNVTLPMGAVFLEAKDDKVWAVFTDEDKTEYVVRYKLVLKNQ